MLLCQNPVRVTSVRLYLFYCRAYKAREMLRGGRRVAASSARSRVRQAYVSRYAVAREAGVARSRWRLCAYFVATKTPRDP